MLKQKNIEPIDKNTPIEGMSINYYCTSNNSGNFPQYVSAIDTPGTTWRYWVDWHYPHVIKESYPVYLQEKAKDTGKQAFEIIKALQDKKLVNLKTVGDFIEAMDTLIKIL